MQLYDWYLLRGHTGRIVNVCSIAGRSSGMRIAAYAAAKTALIALSDSLRFEMALLYGIWVSTIEPQFTLTPMVARNLSIEHFQDTLERELARISASRRKCDEQFAGSRPLPALTDIYSVENECKLMESDLKKVAAVMDPGTDHVVDCMFDALASHCPLKWYRTSWLATVLYLAGSYTPTWLERWINRNLMYPDLRSVLKDQK